MGRVRAAALCAFGLLALRAGVVTAAEQPIRPTFSDVAAHATFEETYAANAFMLIHLGDGGPDAPNSSWRPVRGLVYRVAVERDVFFNSLGRPDLAEQFLSRRAWGKTVKWTGYVAAVSGLFVTIWGLGDDNGALALVGLGALVGGAITREVGEGLLKPVFPEIDALDMADRYNQELRARLGLPALAPPPRRPPSGPTPAGSLAFGLLPLLRPGGAGVAAVGRF